MAWPTTPSVTTVKRTTRVHRLGTGGRTLDPTAPTIEMPRNGVAYTNPVRGGNEGRTLTGVGFEPEGGGAIPTEGQLWPRGTNA